MFPAARQLLLRMPKPLRALEPRLEMPTSRGPLPCLMQIPGLSHRMSPIENEGRLSDTERREYETYVQTIDFIAILQAKARALLKRSAEA